MPHRQETTQQPLDYRHLRYPSAVASPTRRASARPKPPGNHIGRPRVDSRIEQLVIRMATENPRWGYWRIQGALSSVGHHIHTTTVRNMLRRNHMDPALIRSKFGMSWSQFMRMHVDKLAASGCFSTLWLTAGHFWRLLSQSGRTLSACRFQGLSLILDGAISILALVVHQGYGLGFRRLSELAIHHRFTLFDASM